MLVTAQASEPSIRALLSKEMLSLRDFGDIVSLLITYFTKSRSHQDVQFNPEITRQFVSLIIENL